LFFLLFVFFIILLLFGGLLTAPPLKEGRKAVNPYALCVYVSVKSLVLLVEVESE
jgi:hypothetical protein